MKHLKKFLALTLAMIMCLGITTLSVSAAETTNESARSSTDAGYFLVQDTTGGVISSSGTKTITLSKKVTKFSYWIMPNTDKGGTTSGTVPVTFTNSNGSQTHYLKKDAVVHTVYLPSTQYIGSGSLTIHWSGATNISFISITFG